MKSTIALLATVATLTISTQSFADAGTINFKGNVVAAACDVTVNGTASADVTRKLANFYIQKHRR